MFQYCHTLDSCQRLTAASQSSVSEKGLTSHRPLSVTQPNKWKIGFYLLCWISFPPANDRNWVSEREERPWVSPLSSGSVTEDSGEWYPGLSTFGGSACDSPVKGAWHTGAFNDIFCARMKCASFYKTPVNIPASSHLQVPSRCTLVRYPRFEHINVDFLLCEGRNP